MKDLITLTNDITVTDSPINKILTKAADISALTFKTMNDELVAKIGNAMIEFNRALPAAVYKKNSQTNTVLYNVTYHTTVPTHVLKQILNEGESTRGALLENLYDIEKKKIEIERLSLEERKLLKNFGDLTEEDDLRHREIALEKAKLGFDIANTLVPVEQAFKKLGHLTSLYAQIQKNNNIPDNWDELDFEAGELRFQLNMMFENAIGDVMQSTHNKGTIEHMRHYGVEPIMAYAETNQYIQEILKLKRETMSIDDHYAFLDEMYERHKDDYKKVLLRIGIDTLLSEEYLYQDPEKENK